jgi:hypothetical protein
VLAVAGVLAAVFAIATCLLVRREEKSGSVGVAPRAPKVKEPRVRVRPASPELRSPQPPPEPREVAREELPDPRRPALVLNLDAFTEFRSRQ